MGFNVKALISVAVVFAAALPVSAQQVPLDALKGTYVRLANNANAVLWESPNPSPKSRIVIVNTHADHNNNFEYFIGRELATRGYRALNLNYYGPETEFEEFLAPIAAAVRYARSLPGVEKVVFATHSGWPDVGLLPGGRREGGCGVPGAVAYLSVQPQGPREPA